MNPIYTPLIGRIGNQLFQYAKARAIAERDGRPLTTPPWVGEAIFDLPCVSRNLPDAETIEGYGQNQDSLIYTRAQVKQWFKLKLPVEQALESVPLSPIIAHRRVGDYARLGYVVVSEQSYRDAWHKFEFEPTPLEFVTEENPMRVSGLPDWLPDFYRMMRSKVLFRGNSSFSWWAATLSEARIFSPIITGKEGGREQHCEFVSGNWPKFADLPNITDLHLKEGK